MTLKLLKSSHKNKFWAICFIYCLTIVAWFASRCMLFDRFWLAAILNTTAFYFFIPLPFLLILAVYWRQRLALILFILPIFIFIYSWGPLFLPNSIPSITKSDKQLTAMSYNILYSNETPNDLVTSINTASPDIVGLQELRPALIQAVQTKLETDYPHQTLGLFDQRGVGLLSRFPIISVTQFHFPPDDHRALHAIIDWHGRNVHVFVVHLSANNFFDNPLSQISELASERYSQRSTQISILEEELSGIVNPIVLMCDCNLTDTSEAYYRLNQLLDDSFYSAGWGFGHTLHPNGFPFPIQRIDYVWHNEDFQPITSYVGLSGGSDHHPVISTLQLKREN